MSVPGERRARHHARTPPPPRRLLTLDPPTARAAPLPLVRFHVCAASYILPPSTSEQFNTMPEPLKLATETTFKRFDLDCDGQLTIDELHLMVTETANAFGLEPAPRAC